MYATVYSQRKPQKVLTVYLSTRFLSFFWHTYCHTGLYVLFSPSSGNVNRENTWVSAVNRLPVNKCERANGWQSGSSFPNVSSVAAGMELNSWQAQVSPRKQPVFCSSILRKPSATCCKKCWTKQATRLARLRPLRRFYRDWMNSSM